MFHIGRFDASSCGGLTRRSFLAVAAGAPFVSALGPAEAQAAVDKAKAKSTVFVWLWGAPSHIDTFDPKPLAPTAYRGPFSPIGTRVPGVRFTELLPRLAARSDRFSVVRSNVTFASGHPQAGTLGLCGYEESPVKQAPAFGAIVARHRGGGTLPPYLMLGRGVPRDVVRPVMGYGGGDWGQAYDPFRVACDDLGAVDIPALQLAEGLNPLRLTDRQHLADEFDGLHRRVTDERFEKWDRAGQQAFALLTSAEARRAFDLGREPPAVRQAYGQTAFGQSLLLARRLVEASVPFIHVNWSEYVEALTPNTDFGWDTHIHNFDLLPTRHCPIFDRAFAAFLDDLQSRSLLDQTLVVCLGEFGRTPKINNRAARDHWPQCYFSLWAGGGIKPGRVVGASNDKGEEPITRPIPPPDVGTTIAELMGVDSVARAKLNALPGGRTIDELL